MPSGVLERMPAATCSCRPETRTWTNSSRLVAKIARNFGPLEQRALGVLGQREHPGVEVEPGQLAVQQSVLLRGVGRLHGRIVPVELGSRSAGVGSPAAGAAARDPPGEEADRAGRIRGGTRISRPGRGRTLHASTRRFLTLMHALDGDPIADTPTPGDIEVNDRQRRFRMPRGAHVRAGAARTLVFAMATRDPRTYALNPFGRLVVAQAASMVGDACLTVSLAGSIFFTQPVGQSRTQVLLYLLLTIAPFAVVGPIIGPALDRSRAGRRTLMAIGCFGRAAVCFLMVGNLDSLFLFPLAFVALVLSKGHAVAKSALLPAVVNDEHALVEANSRLSLVSVVASVVGGLPAAACVALFDARVSLIFGTIVFGLAGVLCTKIPARRVDPPASRPRRSARSSRHRASCSPAPRWQSCAAASGFLTFQLAFILKGTGQPGVVLRRRARRERASVGSSA